MDNIIRDLRNLYFFFTIKFIQIIIGIKLILIVINIIHNQAREILAKNL